MIKFKNIIISVFLILVFITPVTNAKIIWDGTFHGDEYRSIATLINDPSGGYQHACLISPESFGIVSNFGGVSGISAKFYNKGGTAGECATNNHNLIEGKETFIPYKLYNQEFWIGWSMYQAGDWNLNCDINNEDCVIYFVGACPQADTYGLSGYVSGVGFYLGQKKDGTWVLSLGNKHYATIIPGVINNKWIDMLLHIKLSTGNDGKTELYRSTGYGYVKLASFTGDNWYIQPVPIGNTKETARYTIRVGQYMSKKVNNPMSVYILNPKAGTKCEDVHNHNIDCPINTFPTPTITATVTPTITPTTTPTVTPTITPISTSNPINNYFNLKFIDEIIDYITKLIFSIF